MGDRQKLVLVCTMADGTTMSFDLAGHGDENRQVRANLRAELRKGGRFQVLSDSGADTFVNLDMFPVVSLKSVSI